MVYVNAVSVGKLDEAFLKGYLAGLRCLHGLHYVHGDIEPRHLCISASGAPAIIDLGEARALDTSSNIPRAAWAYRGTLCMLPNNKDRSLKQSMYASAQHRCRRWYFSVANLQHGPVRLLVSAVFNACNLHDAALQFDLSGAVSQAGSILHKCHFHLVVAAVFCDFI